MNGFEKQGIKHSSASSINMFVNAPCAWVGRYLYDKKFTFGPAALAGVLVEDAVCAVICGDQSLGEATDEALKQFGEKAPLTLAPSDVKRRDGMPEMIRLAVEELKPYGKPEFDESLTHGRKQKKIEIMCKGDGWELPIIGYLDFYFPDAGVVVDLKTTMRAPSFMSPEHTRQGSIYRFAMGNMGVKFLYVTPKKAVWHDVEEPKEVLAEIKTVLNRQERLLRLEKDDIKDIIPVNASSYYWSDDAAMRKEMYGL